MAVYRGMSKEEYQALPALNAGGAIDLTRWCAEKYWYTSPLNPQAAARKDQRHFDLGSAVHTYILEREKFEASIAVIDAPNYKTKAAQAARDQARAVGLSPLLVDEIEQIEGMSQALMAHPIAGDFRNGGGDAEVTMIWDDPDFDFPCKLRVDFLPYDLVDLRDVKTAVSAHPEDFERAAWQHGYCQRAAWYIDGVELASGKRPRHYWFIVVEKEPPYLVSAAKYPDEHVEWGRVLNVEARMMFRRCLDSGIWPGYQPPRAAVYRAFDIGIPRWALFRMQDMAEAGQLGTPRSVAELERLSLRHRIAARLESPDPRRDFMPPAEENE